MSALRRVGNVIAQYFYRDTCQVRGQFTGVNNSANTTIQFKGLGTVARTGEGTYVFTLFGDDGVSARKGYHLKNFNIVAINPVITDGLGSGDYAITADAINSAGTLNFTTFNQAGSAADVIGIAKLAIEISTEAAS